jgi:hypothetical protein
VTLAEKISAPGPWTTLFFESTTGTVESLKAADLRPDAVRTALLGQGAPKTEAEAAARAVDTTEGEAGRVCRYQLLRGGEVVVDEILPGRPAVPEQFTWGPVPDLVPLLRQRPSEFELLVVEVGRDGGELRLQHASRGDVIAEEDVAGDTFDVTKVSGGGWAGWAESRWQRRSDEVWKKNAEEVAAKVNLLAEERPLRLIVLSGDERARGLLLDQLSEKARPLVSVVDANTRGGGAGNGLDLEVDKRVSEVVARSQQDVLDRLHSQIGRTEGTATFGTRATVQALQRAQVETLVISGAPTNGDEVSMLVLGGEPWIALGRSDTLGAPVLGEVPAAMAAVRAAVLTGARCTWLPEGGLPDGVRGAALLRWPNGPAEAAS